MANPSKSVDKCAVSAISAMEPAKMAPVSYIAMKKVVRTEALSNFFMARRLLSF